jgi:amino acid adenylation domain-containing protein
MNKDIAIIGMAGRFPGARNLEELYINLREGKNSVKEISRQRIQETALPPDKPYMICGYLEEVDKFDYKLFNISLAEAQAMDPLQRLLLETVYETIGNAGYSVETFYGSNTSIYVGDAETDYYTHADEFVGTLVSGNAKMFHAAKIARYFNMTGSAVMVDTACSSSLVAVHLACRDLILDEADYALACGINLYLFPFKDDAQDLDMWSPDGISRAFSAQANGMSKGEAVAAVLLKPLEKARKDNDVIHAVIKSTAANNNAHRSESPTAPDSISQAEVIKKAWQKAGIDPTTIGYIEAHGSGTQLGDTLEIEGLNRAFREYTDKKKICPISTIKSNVGHSMSAAGLAGLIRAVLSLKYKMIFPTLHFETPNPIIDFDNSAVYVNENLKIWEPPVQGPRRAGVTSLGASGINCHVVLEEAPQRKLITPHPGNRSDHYLVPLSSGTPRGLKANLEQLYRKLCQPLIPDSDQFRIQDIGCTLSKGRKHYPYRFAEIADDIEELKDGISRFLDSRETKAKDLHQPGLKKLILVSCDYDGFPPGMIEFFKVHHPVFRDHFARCQESSNIHSKGFNAFAFQYGFFRLLEASGISSSHFLGVGIGEILHEVIEGILTLEEGLAKAQVYEKKELANLENRISTLLERETPKQADDGLTGFLALGPENLLSGELRKYALERYRGLFHVFSLPTGPGVKSPYLELVRELYLCGYPVDWQKYVELFTGIRIELPGYQFERTRCWLREKPRERGELPGKEKSHETGEVTRPARKILLDSQNPLEETVALFWREVIDRPGLKREDDFFEIGGDSLKGTKVINGINRYFNLQLSFEDIFDYPTIRQLAEYLEGLLGTAEKLAVIWKEVLKVEEVQPGDDFFRLGGHSLMANQVLARVAKTFDLQLNFEDLFHHPRLDSLANFIEKCLDTREEKNMDYVGYQEIENLEKQEHYLVSPTQRRLWVLSQFEGGSIAYNTVTAYLIEGKLNRVCFTRAFEELVNRHESLRTIFITIDGLPRQKVQSFEEIDFQVEEIDLRGGVIGVEESEERIKQMARTEGITPFCFSRGPLLRVKLVHCAGERFFLIIAIHHIVSDGWSLEVFFKEGLMLYEAFCQGEPGPLSPLRIQYKDYTDWLNRQLSGELGIRQRDYWVKQFSGDIPVLNIPTDRPRPLVKTYNGDKMDYPIDKGVIRPLEYLCRETDTTLFMVLMATVNMLLSRYCAQSDIVIGTPIAGRSDAELEGQVGFYANTLALRTRFFSPITFAQLLAQVKTVTLGAYNHQLYPFDNLVDAVKVTRDLSRSPLFDVMAVLQNIAVNPRSLHNPAGLKIRGYDLEQFTSRFDLHLEFQEYDDDWGVRIEYNTDLFDEDRIRRLAAHLVTILETVSVHIDIPIDRVDFLTTEERRRLMQKWNDTAVDYPQHQCLHHFFAGEARKKPGQLALCETDVIPGTSYGQLDREAQQLAGVLRERGIGPGAIIPLLAERSLEMMVGLMAILYTGAAYLPIDPTYPGERLAFIIRDSGSRWVLAQEKFSRQVGEAADVIVLEKRDINKPGNSHAHSNRCKCIRQEEVAYVIYTSGSTGMPKGVAVEHRSIVNRLHWMQCAYPLDNSDVILQKTPFVFDVSVWELFWWSMMGARVCFLAPGAEGNPAAIIETVHRHRVTTMHFVPSMLHVFLEYVQSSRESGKLASLRRVFASGEALDTRAVTRFYRLPGESNRPRLINLYGPTEAAVDVSFFNCEPGDLSERIPIGRPIQNICLWVLSEPGQMQPEGVPGELCISGVGLARGYLNRSELTAEKFIEQVTDAGDRCKWKNNRKLLWGGQGGGFLEKSPPGRRRQNLYKTGDLARWLADGNLEFLGRLDHQVKVRGFRIELGEIESRLKKHENVNEAVVAAAEDHVGDNYLTAYVVLGPSAAVPVVELREFLAGELPGYMIPSYWVSMERIPLTPSGKIDRKALPEPGVEIDRSYAGPGNRIERKLVRIWSDLLGLEKKKISIDDNFFALGGHSLKAAVMIGKIHKELDVKVTLADLFRSPTIRHLSSTIKESVNEAYIPIKSVEKKEYYDLSSAQKRLYVLQQMELESIAYNVPRAYELEGELNGKALENTFRKLIKRHESLRTSFFVVNTEPVQRIHTENYNFQITTYKQISKLVENFIRPFDLSHSPLLRVGLIRKENQTHILMIDMHHIITDGVSMDLFVRETMALYSGAKLPPLKLQYRDYSEWQTGDRQKKTIKEQEEYWLSQFADEVPVLDLPFDYPRPAVQSFEGTALFFEVSAESSRSINRLALDTGATSFMVLLAIYNILLSKLSGQEDIVVGTPIAARRHPDLERIIGMFVNTLAMRNYPPGDSKFMDFLLELKKRTLDAFENQEYQFEDLVEKVSINRDTSRNPLFDTMLVLQNTEAEVTDIPIVDSPQLKISPYETEHHTAKFDLTLNCFETEEKLFCSFEYCIKLFKKATIDRFIIYFRQILSAVLTNRNQKISQIEIITAEGKRRILSDFNDTTASYPAEKTIHRLFAEQVERTPDHVALIGPKLQNTK